MRRHYSTTWLLNGRKRQRDGVERIPEIFVSVTISSLKKCFRRKSKYRRVAHPGDKRLVRPFCKHMEKRLKGEKMKSDEEYFGIKNISKYYPGVGALKNVSLTIRKGEIHALVGENGAGKSTLIKTCGGAIEPREGTITVNGKTFRALTPKLSEQNGIGVIYQGFNLVGGLSVAENIFLGRAIRKGIVVDQKAMEAEAKRFWILSIFILVPKQWLRI